MLSLEGEINLLLNEFATIFKEMAVYYAQSYQNKRGQDTLSTSDLLKSLKVEVADERLVISVFDYYRFVESGRKVGAKGIPLSVLIDWLKKRKIQGRGKDGKSISLNSLAFIIQRSIKKNGIKARPFLTAAYEETSKKFDQELNDLINAIANDVLVKFTKKK